MTDTLPNITLQVNTWINLYAKSGIPVGTAISVENIGSCDVYLAVQAAEPEPDHNSYDVLIRNNGIRLQNSVGDPGAWAFCNSKTGKVAVQPLAETGFYPHLTTDLKTEGELISPENPLPTIDYDGAHRSSANSIFGDKIIGTRIPTIAAQFQYGLRSDDTVIDSVTTGLVSINDAMLKLNTGIDPVGHIGVQGADYLRYIPGHEAYAFFTSVFSFPVIGLIQKIGLFDFDVSNGNGFFIGFNDLQFGVTRRRSGVDTFTPVDQEKVFPKKSGVFDPEKGNVFKISYGYLGFATIHFEVLLPEGSFYEFAAIEYPNTSIETHIANTNIPLRAEMTNNGSVIDSQMRIGSVTAGIVDGGGADPIARVFTKALGLTTINAGATQLLHFRNKPSYFGITNKITSQLILISASTDGNKPVAWGIKKNSDITTSGIWVDADPDSVMEYSADTIVDLNTGVDLLFWDMARADSFWEDVESLIVKLRPNEWATFFVVAQTGSDINMSIRWKDLF